MRFDMTNLDHSQQRQFLESVKNCHWIEDNYYQVVFDCMTNEFLLTKVNYVIKNKNNP